MSRPPWRRIGALPPVRARSCTTECARSRARRRLPLHPPRGLIVMTWSWPMTLLGLLLVGTVIFLENRNPEKTVAWLIVLAVFPVIGFLLYLVLGRNARKRKLFRHKHIGWEKLQNIVGHQQRRLSEDEVLERHGIRAPTMALALCNAYHPLDTMEYRCRRRTGQARLRGDQPGSACISSSPRFKASGAGRRIVLLVRKARTKVTVVVVIVDGLGRRVIPEEFLEEMQRAGIEVELFFPVRFVPVQQTELSKSPGQDRGRRWQGRLHWRHEYR